jgi:hypothetical protein
VPQLPPSAFVASGLLICRALQRDPLFGPGENVFTHEVADNVMEDERRSASAPIGEVGSLLPRRCEPHTPTRLSHRRGEQKVRVVLQSEACAKRVIVQRCTSVGVETDTAVSCFHGPSSLAS